MSAANDPEDEPRPLRPRRRRLLLGGAPLLLLSFTGYAHWDPFYGPAAVEGKINVSPPIEPAVRIMTLNVAHGRGTAFNQILTRTAHIRRNLDAVAKLIRASDADVIALQELDAPSSWSGGFDHLAYLAEKTGYPHRYHGLHIDRRWPNIAYGTGILSRHPVRDGKSQGFGLNRLDTKGFAHAVIEAPEFSFSLVSLHLDFKRDSERRAQLKLVSEFIEARGSNLPVIVAGDFNSAIVDSNGILKGFVERHDLSTVGGSLPTFPSTSPSRRLDDVFVSPRLEALLKRALDIRVSDHLPLLLDVRQAVR